ncbi:enoyl-CoA hydratase/isomerase family protein [Halalkalibacter krulwichiae]|uniref:Putative enoyl-CoA hydratase echA8 n=1 Tax=Halalkalibacter krulwichiae TaxID=199441 RepID=A0A1X9MHN7_9BACI|nr:enoyl-CoA hydratase-related protein [Halalkalibacter krulwichiae]ARK29972.1 putative enoyl-CoA hydratase echA8 [Halalkalibacter krulwichiae]
MYYENIVAYKDGVIGVIKLNRPEMRNAIDSRTLEEVEEAIEIWEKHEGIKVIIFTGEGEKSFASGADIKQLKEKEAKDALLPGLSGVCQKIESSSKVTIAAINGYALGGGCELALACDIRIAAEHAKIGLPELNLSIIPGGGGTQRLARIVGKGRAIEMILMGEVISAEKAENIGLVTRVVKIEDLFQTAYEIAAKIMEKGPLAVTLAKMVIHQGFDLDMKNALLIEKLAQAILFNSEDKHEGVTAFLEKRVPSYNGN